MGAGRAEGRHQEAPVDVGAVPQIGVVRVLCRRGEHELDHALRVLRWDLKEDLHRRRQQLQLHLCWLLRGVSQQGLNQQGSANTDANRRLKCF